MINRRPTQPDIVVRTEDGTAQILQGLSLFKFQAGESIPKIITKKQFNKQLPKIKKTMGRNPIIYWNPSWLLDK